MQSEAARRMLAAARVEAEQIGKPVSVAIVDAAGIPVLFERLDNAAAFTTVVAEGKACASAFTGRDSSQLQGMAENYPTLVSAFATRLGGRFVALGGGVVITGEAGVLGAVGVSGATAEEDEQIARAATAAYDA